jgi:hypothetical protein
MTVKVSRRSLDHTAFTPATPTGAGSIAFSGKARKVSGTGKACKRGTGPASRSLHLAARQLAQDLEELG